MKRIVIVEAKRTPIGSYRKMFYQHRMVEVAGNTIKKCLQNFPQIKIAELFLGNVLNAGEGQNVARQIALQAGLGQKCKASVINYLCGSSLKALELAIYKLFQNPSETYLVGGGEFMSNTAYFIPNAEAKNPEAKAQDTLFHDGLYDPLLDRKMVDLAEEFAVKHQIKREDADLYAFNSHVKAAAHPTNFQEEIIPVTIGEETFTLDQGIRSNIDLAKLQSLKGIVAEDGIVTAGNSSTLNDGFGFCIITTYENAVAQGYPILGEIMGLADSAGANEDFLHEPFVSINDLLARHQLTVDDIDLWEINEAFAVQMVHLQKSLGIDPQKLNIHGGAIALGHPLGMSGIRVMITLLHHLKRTQKKYGIASLCVGGGMGISVLVKNEGESQ